jgi:hypothetical protein
MLQNGAVKGRKKKRTSTFWGFGPLRHFFLSFFRCDDWTPFIRPGPGSLLPQTLVIGEDCLYEGTAVPYTRLRT